MFFSVKVGHTRAMSTNVNKNKRELTVILFLETRSLQIRNEGVLDVRFNLPNVTLVIAFKVLFDIVGNFEIFSVTLIRIFSKERNSDENGGKTETQPNLRRPIKAVGVVGHERAQQRDANKEQDGHDLQKHIDAGRIATLPFVLMMVGPGPLVGGLVAAIDVHVSTWEATAEEHVEYFFSIEILFETTGVVIVVAIAMTMSVLGRMGGRIIVTSTFVGIAQYGERISDRLERLGCARRLVLIGMEL